MDVEDAISDGLGKRASDSERAEDLVRHAIKSQGWKRPKSAIDLGDVHWRPHLVRARPRAILHVQISDRIQPYLAARLRAAQTAGWDVHLVVDAGSLYAKEFVERLAGIDVTVHLAKETAAIEDGRDLLTLLGERSVALPPETVSMLAIAAWERRREGTAHARGRRLEGLLAFMFGQVKGLRVVDTNLRTATEEIDLVLQTDREVDAPWYEDGVPFVLVESKNWSSTVGSAELSTFITKVQYKRERCRIGVMCAAGGLSSDAEHHELRLAATPFTIVMIGPDKIEAWIRSADPTKWLVDAMRRAMLR